MDVKNIFHPKLHTTKRISLDLAGGAYTIKQSIFQLCYVEFFYFLEKKRKKLLLVKCNAAVRELTIIFICCRIPRPGTRKGEERPGRSRAQNAR